MSRDMISGVLNIDKPRGMTSHDVVAVTRQRVGIRAVGHTGTLDPDASGVLVLCLGRATKFARFFEALDKTFWAVMKLGICTDTQDATGVVTRQVPVGDISAAQLHRTLPQFTGMIQQTPPMYSAVRLKGKRLYQLARKGQTVEREPRTVTIRRLELLDLQNDLATLSVTCSKGTYIRTLCEDLGHALGCGAHMVHLQRCRVGPFNLRQAHSLDELRHQADTGTLEPRPQPLDEALAFLPAVTISPQEHQGLRNGQGRALSSVLSRMLPVSITASSYRLCTPADTTVAVMHRQTAKPEKWKVYQLDKER